MMTVTLKALKDNISKKFYVTSLIKTKLLNFF